MKRFIAIILLFSFFISFSTGIQSTAVKNLFPFTDEDISDWLNREYKDLVESGAVSIDTEVVKSGNQSIKIDISKIGSYSYLLLMLLLDFRSEKLEKGKTYTFQVWVKTENLNQGMGITDLKDYGFKLRLLFTGETNEIIANKPIWELMSITFKISDFDAYYIPLMFSVSGYSAGKAWFSGFAIVEGDKPVEDYSLFDTPTPSEAPTPTPYEFDPDDTPSAWAVDEIVEAIDAELVPGHINGRYAEDISRSDFCDLIINMIEVKTGQPIAEVVDSYGDRVDGVGFPDTFNPNVIAAASLGIVNGRANGMFDPDANITRQEAAKMLALIAKVLGADIAVPDVVFADATSIFDWAKEFINYVNSVGIMLGTNTDTPPNFSPLRTYTREQSILTVYRLYGAL